jgi:amphi-Trp domain-containing protein
MSAERLLSGMPEEVLFETESTESRADVAAYLRAVADALDGGEPVTLRVGDRSTTLDVPERVTFEVKTEREGPVDGPGELSLELELEWPEDGGEGAGSGGTLEIE